MPEYIDPSTLEDGQVLLYLKHSFLENKCMETLNPLMSCLRDSIVTVPMNRSKDGNNDGLLDSLGKGDELNMNGIRFKPDILRAGEQRFFPLFSNQKVMPADYARNFTVLRLPMVQVIKLAHSYDVAGLALDPFSENLVLPFEVADAIAELPSNLPPQEPDTEE